MSNKAPLRVLLLNNYSMRKARESYLDGEYPGQHLWGAVPSKQDVHWVLPRGMFDLPVSQRPWFRIVRSAILRTFGDPLQQAAAFYGRVDVIFAADQWSASLLGVLRRFKLLRKPYVVLVHHVPSSTWNKICLRGAAQVAVLSPSVGEQLRQSLGPGVASNVVVLPWGPDRRWCGYDRSQRGGPELDFVSAGRTNRDHNTLRTAVKLGGLSGVIFDGESREDYVGGSLCARRGGPADYGEIVECLARSRSAVVPLANPDVMAGLTEIADASALLVPVVVTASNRLPYRIEAIGAGVEVEAGSAAALLGGIRQVIERPTEYGDGLRHLQRKHNIAAYQDELIAELRRLVMT